MTTYRNEVSGVGDITTWTYDEASGVLLAKTYADGKGLTYTYTDDGKLATRTNARGIVTTYAYDAWGQLLSVDYADTTPDIAYTYDAMGRQTSATDAVGTTTFTYDAFGQLTSEQVSGLYSKTLTRHWDAFGRNVGYSVDGERKQSITYDSVTGRIAESDGFRWDYLAGSNLKSKLTYPNEAVVTWSYEPHRDLLTAVTNATYSTYIYTSDLLGRRTSKNDEQYTYNVRDELIAADEVSYNYDDIGNRTTAEGKTYTANNLNQYTAIDDFAPQYDDDGNQTLIKTETGIWSVVYNAENRPIRWQSGDTVITMAFDRMGRRIEMRTVKDGEETLQRFVYDNYLCIQQLRAPSNTLFHSYVWDPTEPIATRPLVFLPASSEIAYYFHDGNKNVSDLVDIQGRAVHYGYTPFGTPTVSTRSENPYTFSSEYMDDGLGLVYYNYRHYSPSYGRWLSFDPIKTVLGLYKYPNPISTTDRLGLLPQGECKDFCKSERAKNLWRVALAEENVPIAGITLCCGGEVFPCEFVDEMLQETEVKEHTAFSDAVVREAYKECTLKHEIYHASEAKCDSCEPGFASPRGASPSTPDIPGSALFDECAAYTTQINCLLNRRNYDCMTAECRERLTTLIEDLKRKRKTECTSDKIPQKDYQRDPEGKYKLLED